MRTLTTLPAAGECWHSRHTEGHRAVVVALLRPGSGPRLVEYRLRTVSNRRRNSEVEYLARFLEEWQLCEGEAHGQLEKPAAPEPRPKAKYSRRESGEPRKRHVEPNEERGITPRIAEVLSRQQQPYLLAELARERPHGACLVCWRNIPSFTGLHQPLVCSFRAPGTQTNWCANIVTALKQRAVRRQQHSKRSLLAEVAAP